MTTRPQKNNKPPLEETLVECLDIYFQRLGEQKPHAVLAMVTEVIEKSTITYVINKTGGNISKASQILGVTRATLRKKISNYKIDNGKSFK